MAVSKFGIMYKIYTFLKDLKYHFCISASQRHNFIKYREYFGTDTHIIIKYASTIFISRQEQEVVKKIIEQ